MEQLIQVKNYIETKYKDIVEIQLQEDTLKIEKYVLIVRYLYYVNNEIYMRKDMHIRENNGKLNIVFPMENIIRKIEIKDIDEIFEILGKQLYKAEYKISEVKEIKQIYVTGTKIKLLKMYDLLAPPAGTIGIVEFVDDIGQIHIQWENGCSLALVVGIDKFEILKE